MILRAGGVVPAGARIAGGGTGQQFGSGIARTEEAQRVQRPNGADRTGNQVDIGRNRVRRGLRRQRRHGRRQPEIQRIDVGTDGGSGRRRQQVGRRDRDTGIAQVHFDLEGVDQQAVAVGQRGGFALHQRRSVQQHAVGAAILDEVDAVQVTHHRVHARHAGGTEHPVAILGTTDAAADARERPAAAAAELGSLMTGNGEDQALRHRFARVFPGQGESAGAAHDGFRPCPDRARHAVRPGC